MHATNEVIPEGQIDSLTVLLAHTDEAERRFRSKAIGQTDPS